MEELINEIIKNKKLFESFKSIYYLVKDTRGRYVYMNSAFMNFMGCSIGVLYGKPNEIFVQSSEQEEMMTEEDRKILSGEISEFETVMDVTAAKNRRAIVKIVKSPIITASGIVGISEIGIDISNEYTGISAAILRTLKKLSPQERLYLFLISRGLTAKEIHRDMRVEESHGHKVKSKLYKKLNLKTGGRENSELIKLYCRALRSIEND